MDFSKAKLIPLTRAEKEALELELTTHAESSGLRAGMSKTAFKKWLVEMIEAPRDDEIYLSTDGVYQVNVRTFGNLVHVSTKLLTKKPLTSRADLVEIGSIFAPVGAVCVELYPATARLVDTANQYHIWSQNKAISDKLVKLYDERHSMLADRDGVRSCRMPTPESETREWRFVWLPHHGASRDWRGVQEAKNAIFGPECEACDVLFPTSGEEGVFLIGCMDPAFRFGFGWTQRLIPEPSAVAPKSSLILP